MKIYSWNMLFRNAELDRAFDFIAHTDADIFCLQEVPDAFLNRLQTTDWHVAAAPEGDRYFAHARSTHYLVLLSRHPLEGVTTPDLLHREPSFPLRGKLLAYSLFRVGLWSRGLGNRHFLFADLETPDGPLRVVNIHLPLMNPVWRAEEFELALQRTGSTCPRIICGDFNIIESPRVSVLNWLLGGTALDALLWTRERKDIEKRFIVHELANPLRNKSTHPLSRSQLDHILVSNTRDIKEAAIVKDRHGSDHHPIFVEII